MHYQLNRKSRPVVVVPYRTEWPNEFIAAARQLRAVLGPSAARIDHIGSTAVPGLSAKDIIDLQITVQELGDGSAWSANLRSAGFQIRPEIQSDHLPPWFKGHPEQWAKRYARESTGSRRIHIHIRAEGRANQRFALLFRDFLRTNIHFATVYEQLKVRLSELFPESIDNYLYIKDPVVDLIFAAAEEWALTVHWVPGPADC